MCETQSIIMGESTPAHLPIPVVRSSSSRKLNTLNHGAAVAEWLSSWLAEQEDRGSIPGLAT